MPRTAYLYQCDGVIGSNARSLCPHGNENGPTDQKLQPTLASAVNAGLIKGYKRPHHSDDLPPGETTHMCCPDCYREYQRWNDSFPVPLL